MSVYEKWEYSLCNSQRNREIVCVKHKTTEHTYIKWQESEKFIFNCIHICLQKPILKADLYESMYKN